MLSPVVSSAAQFDEATQKDLQQFLEVEQAKAQQRMVRDDETTAACA